jgi:hypothetical protein
MIHLPVKAVIGFFTEKMGQLPAHQGGELGAQRLSDILSDHLEGFVGRYHNLLEYTPTSGTQISKFMYVSFFSTRVCMKRYDIQSKFAFFPIFQNLHNELFTAEKEFVT